jgi:NitT/TauT family transport system substrate-binding protein
VLEDAGMDPETDVNFVAVGGASTSVPALLANQVDALATVPSTIAVARSEGADLRLAADTLAGTAGSFTTTHSGNLGVSTADFLSSKQEAFDRYCVAINDAIEWMADDANAEAGATYLSELSGLDPESSAEVYAQEAKAWLVDISEERWAADLDFGLGPDGALDFGEYVVNCG